MSQNNIELIPHNGGALLTHWDSIHGDDVTIQLYQDGMVTIRDTDGIERECNLSRELIKLAKKIND